MKKIFLLLFILTCLLSFNFANAGVNETGSSSISLECKKTMLKKYQSDLSVSKSEGKNFLMYASVTENDCVWYQTWPKKEVSKKDHKYAFKKCTKEAKKNGLNTDCFIYHSGTGMNQKGEIIAKGGRVLSITAKAKNYQKARLEAYETVSKINWENGFYRTDIADF